MMCILKIQVHSTTITVENSGINKIRLYGIDTGAVVDKIVITTGTKYDSFYGAPESYNTTYNNKPMVMPKATAASTEIKGKYEKLFTPSLYTASVESDNSKIESVSMIKLDDINSATITVGAYDAEVMISSKTVNTEISAAEIEDLITIIVDFYIP